MNIGIVGAGIMGQLLAVELHHAGHEISIFDQHDKHDRLNCSMAAAGLLAPITELDKGEYLISQLGMEAIRDYWPAILSKLDEDIYYQYAGSILLSHPHDRADLHDAVERIQFKCHNAGFTYPVTAKLNQAELLQLEPELSRFDEAYVIYNEGQIDNQACLHALTNYLDKQQINWHSQTIVTDISPRGVMANNQLHDFDYIFDCRGLGAKSAFAQLQAVRGEIIWLNAPDVNIRHPIRFMHPRYRLYVVPRPNHVYLVGASEIFAEDYSDISVRTTLELLTAAYYLHPGFAEARIIKNVTQCRPTLIDQLPKIKQHANVIAINGLYRHGFLIAPTLAVEISRWITQGETGKHYPQLWECTG